MVRWLDTLFRKTLTDPNLLSSLVFSCLVTPCYLYSSFLFFLLSLLFFSLLFSPLRSLLILSFFTSTLLFSSLRVLSSLLYFSLAGTGELNSRQRLLYHPLGSPICFFLLFFSSSANHAHPGQYAPTHPPPNTSSFWVHRRTPCFSDPQVL